MKRPPATGRRDIYFYEVPVWFGLFEQDNRCRAQPCYCRTTPACTRLLVLGSLRFGAQPPKLATVHIEGGTDGRIPRIEPNRVGAVAARCFQICSKPPCRKRDLQLSDYLGVQFEVLDNWSGDGHICLVSLGPASAVGMRPRLSFLGNRSCSACTSGRLGIRLVASLLYCFAFAFHFFFNLAEFRS